MASRSIGERHRDLIAFGSGLVFAASTPPFDLTPGILVGLGLFAFSRPSAKRGFLFGLGANLEALRFVPDVIKTFTDLATPLGWLALVLLAAAQAIPWTIAGALAKHLTTKRGIPAALAFGVSIYVGTLIPALFPWTPAGGLSAWPVFLQIADAVGERGVSLVLALACALIATLDRKQIALGVATFAVLLGYGAIRMHSIDAARAAAPHVQVALVEPDFDAMMRTSTDGGPEMMTRLARLTRAAEAEGAELVVWPESAYPYTLKHGVRISPYGERAVLQYGVHGPVLTGAYLSKSKGIGTNSALLVFPGGTIAPSYDKRHLLWFGETIPLADELPVLRQIFARGTGLDAGTKSIALKTGPIVASILNCYEDTLPIAGREAMAPSPRPNLLVNVTNDAWFFGTQESELHLRTAVPRAIETRRDLVRAVNRGPTTWVDANGRIVKRLDPSKGAAYLLAEPALLDQPLTLYSRAGELPMLLLTSAIVLGLARRHRRGPAANAGETPRAQPAPLPVRSTGGGA